MSDFLLRRWENDVPHHPEAERLLRGAAKLDTELELDLRFGGDGDFGEALLYLLSEFMERDESLATAQTEAGAMTTKNLCSLIREQLDREADRDPDRDSEVLKAVLRSIRSHWSRPWEARGEAQYDVDKILPEREPDRDPDED